MANDYIRREDVKNLRFSGGINHDGFLYVPYKELVDGIKAVPSADVVQVRHGKWKKIGAWGRVYRCDQCGNFLDFDGVNAGRGTANFCPNCGAKMDGKRKE